MKRLFLALCVTACMMGGSAQSFSHNRLTVVVTDEGGLVGRYVRQTDSTYVANPVDWEVEVPKTGYRVEDWTPEKGKGFVVRRGGVTGNINVRKSPSVKAAIVERITPADGRMNYPDCAFDCLGKKGEWYKISIRGKVGYVREDLVDWAAYYAD